MIPISVNKKTLDDYKDKLLKFIENKDGTNQIDRINDVLETIEPGLNLNTLITYDCYNLKRLKPVFNRYYSSLNDLERADPVTSLSIFLEYYTSFSHTYGPTLMTNLGIEVCPYCNRNYIFNAGNRRTSEFDHFIPKKPYWIFAISFFNLIPVCHTCNHIKSNQITKIKNPYDPKLTIDTFKFFPVVTAIDEYNIEFKEINTGDKNAADDLKDKLKIKEIYSHHSYIVKDLYRKSQIYQPEYLKKLREAFFNNSYIVNPTQSEFNRLILGSYGDDKDLYIHPLSKATIDIANILGFYQKI